MLPFIATISLTQIFQAYRRFEGDLSHRHAHLLGRVHGSLLMFEFSDKAVGSLYSPGEVWPAGAVSCSGCSGTAKQYIVIRGRVASVSMVERG